MNKTLLASLSLTLGILVALFYVLNRPLKPSNDRELALTSVMVTRMDGRSGGSGVILRSSNNGSEVLTNAHVCEILGHGGYLSTDTQKAPVVSYRVSELHDLCLVNTKNNLGVNTVVASDPPELDSPAHVVGHPSLYPTITTHGHFSRYLTIPVMKGVRPCTDEELNGDLGLACLFLGGIPIIKFEYSQVISATIESGSSGSPVFTRSGEIGGLVFAGAQGLSYGFIVPQEYVKNFVENEVATLEDRLPNTELDISEMMEKSDKESQAVKKFLEACENDNLNNEVEQICNSVSKVIVLE